MLDLLLQRIDRQGNVDPARQRDLNIHDDALAGVLNMRGVDRQLLVGGNAFLHHAFQRVHGDAHVSILRMLDDKSLFTRAAEQEQNIVQPQRNQCQRPHDHHRALPPGQGGAHPHCLQPRRLHNENQP